MEQYSCPFCAFKDSSDYQLLLHVELNHNEKGESPFAVKDALAAERFKDEGSSPDTADHIPARSASPDILYVECPYKCGERLPESEIEFHKDFHMAEDIALDDAGISRNTDSNAAPHNGENAVAHISPVCGTGSTEHMRDSITPHQPSSSPKRRKRASLKELFFGSTFKRRPIPQPAEATKVTASRLGKAELGPFAYEKRMPSWLMKLLEEGSKSSIINTIGPDHSLVRTEVVANEIPGLIPVLAKLSAADKDVARAFYCSPAVHHIAKLKGEGGFCGYRNIQMLISYIREVKASGYEKFSSKCPSILRLQDLIEHAWDIGFNSDGRIETGGIKFTRKYIGTPEAQALFLSLCIPCEAMSFNTSSTGEAYIGLIKQIFEYFDNEDDGFCEEANMYDSTDKVVVTSKPPIYLQHKGHSMTIVGVEVHNDGSANLVVFDPMFSPSQTIRKAVNGKSIRTAHPARLIKAHRRGESYLSKYSDFELLKIGGFTNKTKLPTR